MHNPNHREEIAVKVRFVTTIEIEVDVPRLLELDESQISDELAIEAATSEANVYLQTVYGDGREVTASHAGLDALQEAEVIR